MAKSGISIALGRMNGEELIARLNSIEKRIFALQQDLPILIAGAIEAQLIQMVRNLEVKKNG